MIVGRGTGRKTGERRDDDPSSNGFHLMDRDGVIEPREGTVRVNGTWMDMDPNKMCETASSWCEFRFEVFACIHVCVSAASRRLEGITGRSIALQVRRPQNPTLAITASFIKATEAKDTSAMWEPPYVFRIDFGHVFHEVRDRSRSPLGVAHAMGPPALFVGLWHGQALTEPENDVVMDYAPLLKLCDPGIAQASATGAPLVPTLHALNIGADVLRQPIAVIAPVGQRDKALVLFAPVHVMQALSTHPEALTQPRNTRFAWVNLNRGPDPIRFCGFAPWDHRRNRPGSSC